MKKNSVVNVVVAVLALFISGQLFAEEQEVLDTKAVKGAAAKEVNALSSPKEKGRDYLVYVSGGLLGVQEDIDATVGEGSSYRFAGGIQYNKWFGLECYGELTSPIAPRTVLDDLERKFDRSIVGYSISTKGNKYVGIVGKFSYEIKPAFSLVAKVGIAAYEAHQVTADLTLDEPTLLSRYGLLTIDRGVQGYTPVVSIGYEIPVPYQDSKKTSGEVSFTQMFDDNVKHPSLNVSLKYTF